MQKKPFTIWLILLIVILGPITVARDIMDLVSLETQYPLLLARYPSLPLAFGVCKNLTIASSLASVLVVIVLCQRRPGTLGMVKTGIIVRTVLMLAANLSLPIFLRFPAEGRYGHMFISLTLVMLATAGWYLYLIRSKKVREIYAA